MNKPFLIAEIGINHNGDINIAKQKVQYGKKQINILCEAQKDVLATYQASKAFIIKKIDLPV